MRLAFPVGDDEIRYGKFRLVDRRQLWPHQGRGNPAGKRGECLRVVAEVCYQA
jgi:hypothetical protein